MKRRDLIAGVAVATVASAASNSKWSNRFTQQLRDDFLAHWRVEKRYSLEVLEAMPKDHFDFKPTPVQRSFSEQIAHYSYANCSYFEKFGKSTPRPATPDETTPQTLRTFLAQSYSYVEDVLLALTEEDFTRRDISMGPMPLPHHTAQDIFLRAYMHSAHHRGSVVVYLRLVGVKPPRWRFLAQGVA
jgi:uncharacterized damage-inducible protein DinB